MKTPKPKNKEKQFRKIFSSLKLRKNTQKVMGEIDEGYDEH